MSEQVLFKVLMGSHLYGTNGPNSDEDYKELYLPSLNHVLLGKRLKNRQTPGAIEKESIPIQVYLDHFFIGQTYAIEMAYVAAGKWKAHSWVSTLIERFLTRDVQKMMGYAISQSRIYGLKSERAAQLQTAYDTVIAASIVDPTILMLKMEDAGPLKAIQALPFVKQIEILGAEETKVPAVEIIGKKFPYSATWSVVLHSLERSLNLYGERAKSYSETKADLKALSHAIRIIGQISELCETGWITFPRPNAKFLTDVKYGRVPVADAKTFLEAEFERVEMAVENSRLPERTPALEAQFDEFKIKVLREYYGL